MPTGKTCGDAGGISRNGDPCGQVTGGGRCRHHTDEATDRQISIKADFLEKIQDPLMSKETAAVHCGSSVMSIWRMRQEDSDFDAAVCEIHSEADKKRLEMVEDSLFKRIVEGKAAASETLFWLMNRGASKWQDKRFIQHTVEGNPREALAKLLNMKPEDLPE